MTLFSVATRAFTSTGTGMFARSFTRAMSSGTPETTIVDICSQKIKAALDATEVKVTGTN